MNREHLKYILLLAVILAAFVAEAWYTARG